MSNAVALKPSSFSIYSDSGNEALCHTQDKYEYVLKSDLISMTQQIGYWQSMHKAAVEREQDLTEQLKDALAKNRDLNQRVFGKKTEKKTPRSDKAFIGKKSDKQRGQQPGSKGHGRSKRGDLEVREEAADFPEGEACCPECQMPFLPHPETEDADYTEIEVKAYTRRVKRKRYRPGCACKCNPGMIASPMPPRLLRRNDLGVSVWTNVLLDKYLYARATNRLLQEFQSYGLNISPGTICGGLKKISPMLKPVYAAFHAKQMTESLFAGDETRWSVFETVDGKTGHRWWLWIVISNSVTYYYLAPGRGADLPIGHFKDFRSKLDLIIFLCDRFSSYKKMAKDMAKFILAFCWAHVRRDFIKAARSYPDEKEWMLDWVEQIGTLYHINNQRRDLWDDSKSLQQQSEAFMEQHHALECSVKKMEQQRDDYLAQADLAAPRRSVLTSLKNHWKGLTVFLNHPEVRMDNNISEQAARKGAIGRNNYYGSGSVWSGELAAMMFTLMQTLRQWGINQHHWMTLFLTACSQNGSKCPDDLTSFLPWTMTEELKACLSRPLPPKPPPDTS